MCVAAPLAIASFGLQATSAIMAHKAQNAAYDANKKQANGAQAVDLNALSLRGTQESDAAANATRAAEQNITGDEALQNLTAQENGVGGNSVHALMGELERQKGQYADSVAENLHNQLTQVTAQKAGVVAQTQTRINSVQKANPMATALKIGSAALSTFNQIQGQKPAYGGGADAAAIPTMPMSNTPNLASLAQPMPQVAPVAPLNIRING